MRFRVLFTSVCVSGLLVVSSPPLWSDDSSHFGLQLSAVIPQGDIKNDMKGSLGGSFGIQWTIPTTSGQILRPRLDISALPSVETIVTKTYGLGPHTSYYSFRPVESAVGLEYLYFPSGKTEGLYFFGGCEYFYWGMPASGGSSSGGIISHLDKYKTTTGIQPSIGIGYQLSPIVAFESRFTQSFLKLEPELIQEQAMSSNRDKAILLEFGISWRF